MLQKKWFKVIIWFLATAFFFLASAIVISMFNPNPDERSIMSFLSGMMNAMDSSTMGYTMEIKEDSFLKNIIYLSEIITIPIIAIGTLCGVIVRVRRNND